MSNKYKSTLIVLFSMITLVIIVALSYAYYVIKNDLNTEILVQVSDDGELGLSIMGHGDVNIHIDEFDMQQSIQDEYAVNMNVGYLLYYPSIGGTCTFDYVWKWNDDSDSYVASSADEFTITNPNGQTYNITASDTNLGSGSISSSHRSTRAISFNVRFKNYANIDQSANNNKSLKGKVDIANVSCSEDSSGSITDEHAKLLDAVTAMSSYDSYIENNDFDRGNYGLETGLSSGENGIVDYGYYGIRYVGNNPDNFVMISTSGSLWRIIGVVTDATGERFTKIVNVNPIGSMAYDKKNISSIDSYYGYWGDSQLNATLNGGANVYNNLISAKNDCLADENCNVPKLNYCYNNYYLSLGQDNCDDVIAYTPGSYYEGSNSVYVPHTVTQGVSTTWTDTLRIFSVLPGALRNMISNIKEYQNYLYDNTSTAPEIYASEHKKSDQIWYGNIVIPYVSDYIFAGSGTENKTRQNTLYLNSEIYYANIETENNWMFNMNDVKDVYYTMTSSGSANYNIDTDSGLINLYDNESDLQVLPAYYLDSDVVITGGLGTKTAPYILELEN